MESYLLIIQGLVGTIVGGFITFFVQNILANKKLKQEYRNITAQPLFKLIEETELFLMSQILIF